MSESVAIGTELVNERERRRVRVIGRDDDGRYVVRAICLTTGDLYGQKSRLSEQTLARFWRPDRPDASEENGQ